MAEDKDNKPAEKPAKSRSVVEGNDTKDPNAPPVALDPNTKTLSNMQPDNPDNFSVMTPKPALKDPMAMPEPGMYQAVRRNLRNPFEDRWYRVDEPTQVKASDTWLRSQVRAGLIIKVD